MSDKNDHKREKDALNAEKSVVLGDTLATSRSTSLDLSNAKGNNKVGNDGVLRLTTTVGDHDTPAVRLSKLRTISTL